MELTQKRYINISQLVPGMNPTLIDSLSVFHVFIGSDVKSAFMKKGKLKLLKLMNFQMLNAEVSSALGTTTDLSNEVFAGLEMFVCGMYVDDVRYAYFQQHYVPKGNDYPLDKIKGINPCSMPPCKADLKNQILRVNYIAYIWKNATLSNPKVQRPEGHGWILIDVSYQIKWFDCDQVPHSICQVVELDTSPSSPAEEEFTELTNVERL